jgi:hypothetical protein
MTKNVFFSLYEKAMQGRDELKRKVFSYVVNMFNKGKKKSMPSSL